MMLERAVRQTSRRSALAAKRICERGSLLGDDNPARVMQIGVFMYGTWVDPKAAGGHTGSQGVGGGGRLRCDHQRRFARSG